MISRLRGFLEGADSYLSNFGEYLVSSFAVCRVGVTSLVAGLWSLCDAEYTVYINDRLNTLFASD